MRHSSYILDLYRRLMCRRAFYSFNKALYFLSLKGIGIGNWETPEISGERDFLRKFAGFVDKPVVFDIGANVGNYSTLIKELSPCATIYAFEPHPGTFKHLDQSAHEHSYTAINAACGSNVGVSKLFDHRDGQGDIGSEHASMIRAVIETVHSDSSNSWDIVVTTIDSFVEENAIGRIDLLKIDVEGGEMDVLHGAQETLAKNLINFIQFEFNEANTVSRVFMKDYFELLAGYSLYRMLPDGLAPLQTYYSPIAEIFAYQNIVAVNKNLVGWNEGN